MMTEIGFLGGTGAEARGLALRFAAAGFRIVLGSRERERAEKAAEACNQLLADPCVRGSENAAMLKAAALVFLTTPYHQAVNAVEACRYAFRADQILVDVTVPMAFAAGRPCYVEQEEGSMAEHIARHLPGSLPLVAAFKTIPAAVLGNLALPLDCDVFLCGDVPQAKIDVMAAVSRIPAVRPLDAGSLSMARTLERMAVLAATLNAHYRKRGARFRVVGL